MNHATQTLLRQQVFVNKEERMKAYFDLKYEVSDPPDQTNPHYAGLGNCWKWKGPFFGVHRYGSAKVRGFKGRAHRLSYILHHGCIPDGMHVLHKCDTRECVNPNHLMIGDHQANMDDRSNRGRTAKSQLGDKHYSRSRPESVPRGEKLPQSKVTEQQVREIRVLAGFGMPQAKIGMQYGVKQKAVSQIVRRESWSHIP